MRAFAAALVLLSTTQSAALSLGLRAAAPRVHGIRRRTARACAAETPAAAPQFVTTSTVEAFPVSPPMNLSKYETMQQRRTEVTVNYAGGGGWAALARETIDIVKGLHPDVRVRRVITSAGSGLQVKVDGTTIAASNRDDSIFLSLSRIDTAVERARQRRRPARTVYAAAASTEANDGKEQRKAERRAQLQAAESPPASSTPAPTTSDDE
tara:strand:- start:662 stop:1291 length:630 start_codon:yes stop_codon:yes gene_type:complete